MLMNDISPMRQGQTEPAASWNLVDANNRAVPIANGTVFTCYIYSQRTNVALEGAGTFDLTNIASSIVVYNWSALDSATPGEYEVFVGYVTPGGKQGFTDPVEWTVTPLFVQQ
jgi:hypothetical protein